MIPKYSQLIGTKDPAGLSPLSPALPFSDEAPRLGILGGSFNPPHVGHVLQARHAWELLGLTRLDVLPAAAPPHKPRRGLLPFDLRVTLTRLAMQDAGLSGLRIEDREGRRAGPSYTIDTLREYAAELPGWEIIFLMGSIDLPTLPTWKDGLRINSLAHLAVHPREEDEADQVAQVLESGALGRYARVKSPLPDTPWCWRKAEPPGKLLWYLECGRLPVCATDIRTRWRPGEPLDTVLPPAVLAELLARRDLVGAVWGEEPGAH
ncbi:nicotinate-nicotinamide nucleotide adenylyltransferase [Megalodesulfovibrio gigas]|uniref:nicotinate-nicotinamide nucleotide adenylyltransferase n=1 Tax=Megalodesulfovibrio gigas TaxID=879 RepID=UPI0004178997|nr:nicotinate-nicotinamide nucleotide adenylyltransferase [Megalodesulfovibrio gigas]